MAIKAIIFDCFGVLITSGRNLLYQSYPHLITDINDLEHQSDYGMISHQQFDVAMAELIGVTPEEVRSRYYNVNAQNKATIDWARELKTSNQYKIGMLSNIGHGWLDKSLIAGNEDLFDEIIISGDVGMVKPEVAIFELTANRLGVESSDCVMIDDMAVNIDGAISAGMQGIIFNTVQQAKVELAALVRINNA